MHTRLFRLNFGLYFKLKRGVTSGSITRSDIRYRPLLISNFLFYQPMMPERIFDFSLAVTIFIILYRAYFNSASSEGFVYHSANIRNEKTDNSGCSVMFFRRKEMLFCYFM